MGWARGRVAKQAVDIAAALPIVERWSELAEDESLDPAEGTTFYEGGQTMMQGMLDHTHGASSHGLPSNANLGSWQHVANVCAFVVSQGDPGWLASYKAGLPDGQRRLIESMVRNGELRARLGQM